MKIPKGEVMSSPPYLLTDFLSFPIFPDQKDTFGDYVCVCLCGVRDPNKLHTYMASNTKTIFFYRENSFFWSDLISSSELRSYLATSGGPLKCWECNLDQRYARQVPYKLYCHFGPDRIFKVGTRVIAQWERCWSCINWSGFNSHLSHMVLWVQSQYRTPELCQM